LFRWVETQPPTRYVFEVLKQNHGEIGRPTSLKNWGVAKDQDFQGRTYREHFGFEDAANLPLEDPISLPDCEKEIMFFLEGSRIFIQAYIYIYKYIYIYSKKITIG